MVKCTSEDAAKMFGSRVHIAALAVIDEGDKVRVLHDGSDPVQVTHRIRPRGQLLSPGAGALRALAPPRRSSRPWLWEASGTWASSSATAPAATPS